MMKDVFVVSDNIISPVGITADANFHALLNNESGVKEQLMPSVSATPFYASLFTNEIYRDKSAAVDGYTKFEQLIISSVSDALQNSGINIQSAETILIISSTKGNVSILETEEINAEAKQRIGLYTSANKISAYFKVQNNPIIISNACISGLTALLTGKRLLEMEKYKHAVVVGADIISSFILSGFQSFQAISALPCKPFDEARNGINLGEAAATIILSSEIKNKPVKLTPVKITGGAITNDANHISGPSRSGQELCIAINKAMKQANVSAADIGFISAHGTATVYNDEMEAKAFSLAAMEAIPLNSLKGYYGHTLGAAGAIEAVYSILNLQHQEIYPALNFKQPIVATGLQPVQAYRKMGVNHVMSNSFGFGGNCTSLIFSKASL